MKVRLKNEVLNRLNHPKMYRIKNGMQKPMGVTSYTTVWYSLKMNEWNGNLTKESVLVYLSDALGMTRDEMLEIVED